MALSTKILQIQKIASGLSVAITIEIAAASQLVIATTPHSHALMV
jgi:hypothetical protein